MYKTREEMEMTHQKEVNEFPIVFAFSNEQFEQGAREVWGMKTLGKTNLSKICSIGMGGYILKADKDRYIEMLKRHAKEKKEFNADFKNLVEQIKYEMYNHEYTYVPYEVEDEVRSALYLYQDHPRFEEAWNKAKKEVLKKAGFEGIA